VHSVTLPVPDCREFVTESPRRESPATARRLAVSLISASSPPTGWTPDPNWQPDSSWPAAPPGWQFWIPDEHAPVGQRNTRSIPQDVKIAVAARDCGRCRQCGSSEELHFDHVIAWSKGGSNTIANIQLLCGPSNRRKGADDIPATL
jgi:5-methylcytosine-specific restriction endonuclease McrA